MQEGRNRRVGGRLLGNGATDSTGNGREPLFSVTGGDLAYTPGVLSLRRDCRTACVCALLILGTVGAYWPLFRCGFLNFDDPDYVTDNWVVQQGLTLHGVAWAFTTGHAGNWHPLTWLSHMLDCQLFSLKPAAHHATNLCFHVINSLLVFWLLKRMTGSLGRSAVAAALFALHPIHVESVAWISERKDVLSTCFGLLSISAYVSYAKAAGSRPRAASGAPPGISRLGFHVSGSASWYLLSLLLFAFSLMSKPMLVTLPFLLLLLDYWPLKRMMKDELRMQKSGSAAGSHFILHPSSFWKSSPSSFSPLPPAFSPSSSSERRVPSPS